MVHVGLSLVYITVFLMILTYLQIIYKWKRRVKIVSRNLVQKVIKENVKELPQAPGPFPWIPILGNLVVMGQYEKPFEAFSALAKTYGDVYTLTLGSTRCLVVNSLTFIREVLNQNGKYFGGRPDFLRFHKIFGGDRNNSLALCDWSSLQQKRRNLARKHCSPRDFSSYHQKVSDAGCLVMEECMERLRAMIIPGEAFHLKPMLMQTCFQFFSEYMCSTRFDYDDESFLRTVRRFDEIFWEINQGYAVDFLPWLSPFYKKHMRNLAIWSEEIRVFIMERIINARVSIVDEDSEETDFTDALLRSLKDIENVSQNTIIYMLEDFLGGHSAIGNLVMLVFGYIAKFPNIGVRIQEEVDRVSRNGERIIILDDLENMPYTEATIFEVLRHSSSPIVPHVATENTVIAGYGIMEGTIVFINNYDLNTNEKYWDKPKDFNPDRFIEFASNTKEQFKNTSVNRNSEQERGKNFDKNNNECTAEKVMRVKKNIPHFLPFSVGKRTCIGQNLVKGFSFLMVTHMMQQYNISSEDPKSIKMHPACVALEPDTYALNLTPREKKKK